MRFSLLHTLIPCYVLLNGRELRRHQKATRNLRIDRAIRLARSLCLVPLRVSEKCIPPLLPVRHALPRQHIRQVVAVGPHERGPESDLLDSVLLPDTQCMILKTCEQIGHTAWDRRVDAEFVDHVRFKMGDAAVRDCQWILVLGRRRGTG